MRLIVPFPAGSATDVVSRLLAQKFSDRLGQQFVVENRAGASGAIGVDIIAKAAPDGTTMGLITASTHALAPALGAKLPYDTVKDFKPVSMIFDAPYALVLYPGIPVKTVADLVALAKTKPGKFNYGSAGLASLAHLAGALFAHADRHRADPRALPQLGAILDRHDHRPARHAVRDRCADARQHPRRQAAALATTGTKRVAALPDVPTMIEAGVPDYDVSLWAAYAMPAGTPDEIVAKLNAEMRAILSDAETVEALQKQGFEPDPGPPDAVTKRIQSETEKWRALVAKTGIKAE